MIDESTGKISIFNSKPRKRGRPKKQKPAPDNFFKEDLEQAEIEQGDNGNDWFNDPRIWTEYSGF